MKPALPFDKAHDQMALRLLKLEQSQVPTAGRVMFCRGRRVLGYGDVSKIGTFRYVPEHADTICISAADFEDLREWRG